MRISQLLAFLTAAACSLPALAAHHEPGPVRRARTGHVTNYDEAKVGHYVLPPLLTLDNGQPVRNARDWFEKRRPEILRNYEEDIYGRVPANAPKAHAVVLSSGDIVEHGAAVRTHVVIHFGPNPSGPKADVVLYVPAHATHPVPVLLQLVFVRGLKSELPQPPLPSWLAHAGKNGTPISEIGPVAEILARGYAYATFRYTDVQPDHKGSSAGGVEALAMKPGQTQRTPDEWGSITAWAWGASRVLDYLATDPRLDAKRVALIGHSRLGKTVLWASALDPRFALVFSSCSGEMGAALSRRDYGESIDDIAVNFPWQFARNFQQYVGDWNKLPVDAHMLVALSAPRPVFITGGTKDQWADPHGEFLAEVAAAPVYRLLGGHGLGTDKMPPVGKALVSGDLGWRYHAGPHAIMPGDWQAFLDFADRHLHPGR